MASSKRLFVALWPDEPVRRQLYARQQQIMTNTGFTQGRVAFENMHMTLQFLGQVSVTALDQLDSRLSRVAVPSFQLTLDCRGQFAKTGILWLGPSQPADSLLQLQADVAAACRPYHKTAGKTYSPHVSLFRKCHRPVPLTVLEPVEWLIDHFVLVESMMHSQGVQYRLLQTY